jgi:hypothetical protein
MAYQNPGRCGFDGCSQRAVFHIAWAAHRRVSKEQHFCEEHAHDVLATGIDANQIGSGDLASATGATCFDIEMVIITEINDQQVVYLREVGGKRYIPILIGIFEATMIDRQLKGFTAPRPLTHDVMADAIDSLGGKVQDVLIKDFA